MQILKAIRIKYISRTFEQIAHLKNKVEKSFVFCKVTPFDSFHVN